MGGRRAVVGVDLGTSGVKVLVVELGGAVDDTDGLGLGRVLGRGRAEYPVLVPAAGRAESDPAAWWRAIGRAVGQAVAQARGAEIVALAVAGQMHGVVLTGPDAEPARPAILWLDQRAAVEADRYARLSPALTGVLGNRPSAGMAGPLLAWLVAHEPASVDAARWALQPKDWVRLRMTGEAATEPTDASGTLLYDLRRDAWADGLIAALGLPGGKLPPVRGSAEVAGALLPGPAAELGLPAGLPAGLPVIAGAADTAAALYAADLAADEAMLTLGSGGQWAVRADAFAPTPATNLFRAVGHGYYRLAPVQNVGVTLNWVRTLLGVSWAELYQAADRPARPGGPVFAPYLTPERWDPGATGIWTGLTLATDRQDLLRSALDGVATLLRERLDDLRSAGHDPARLVLGGGGAAHPAWRALLAGTIGLPLRAAPSDWLTAVGAARLAAASQPALVVVGLKSSSASR